MRPSLLLRFLGFALLAGPGCKKTDKPIVTATPPTIASISPDTGPKNTAVTIHGNNFGTDMTQVTVTFNGVTASVQSVSNTSMVALVPAKAGSGKVSVKVGSQSVDGPIFNYVPTVTVGHVVSGNPGFGDGTGSSVYFKNPVGITVDSSGNLYLADMGNYCIRKITPAGVVSTIAGDHTSFGLQDGIGTAAKFITPTGISFDAATNSLVIGDYNNVAVRRVNLTDNNVTTLTAHHYGFSDGSIATASFVAPYYLSVDAQSNIFIIDYGNSRIRKITGNTTVSTVAGNGSIATGDGPALGPTIALPTGITLDAVGNIYLTEPINHSVRKISGGNISTLAGGAASPAYADGNGAAARFGESRGLVMDNAGNIYLADKGNYCIRKITPAGVVSTLAGNPLNRGFSDGDASTASFYGPGQMTIDNKGVIYVVDGGSQPTEGTTIRKITLE